MKENIKKFIDAQNAPGFSGYANAQKELVQGKKLSHWIWYVFPKLKAISQDSPYDRLYGIENLQEAKEYLEDSTLRARLEEVCSILLKHQGKTASGIFGYTDAGKVRSSMTLFYLASNDDIFKQVLDKYYNGVPCQDTLYALNMSMPRKGGFNTHKDNLKDEYRDSKTHSTTNNTIRAKGRGAGTINKGRKPSKARKFKKIVILFAAFVVIVGVFGGIGYGAYSLFTKEQQTDREETLAQNSVSESTEELIKDKNVIITIVTSDNVTIDKEGVEKYFIQTSAPLSGNTCLMDTVTNTYNLHYTKDNYNEDISFNVSIEGCTIGEKKYTYQALDTTDDDIRDNLTLSVSSTDLGIYEELAWYVSVNQQVAEAKYSKYIDRIKSVKNENFAALLTKKLKTIGKIEHKVNQEKSSSKEYSDVIPDEIRKNIMMARPTSMSMAKNLNSEQRRVIIEYNHWVMDAYRKDRRDVIRRQLSSCRTFIELRHIIRKYERDYER